jgi:hypothetical protein
MKGFNIMQGNHYPGSVDPEIVADDRLIPAQEKLACCVVMMAGFGLKSAKKKKKMLHSTKKLSCIDRVITW